MNRCSRRTAVPFRGMTETEKLVLKLIRESCKMMISMTSGRRKIISTIQSLNAPFSTADVVRKECGQGSSYHMIKILVKCGFLLVCPQDMKKLGRYRFTKLYRINPKHKGVK